jgi:hypothetical protein
VRYIRNAHEVWRSGFVGGTPTVDERIVKNCVATGGHIQRVTPESQSVDSDRVVHNADRQLRTNNVDATLVSGVQVLPDQLILRDKIAEPEVRLELERGEIEHQLSEGRQPRLRMRWIKGRFDSGHEADVA